MEPQLCENCQFIRPAGFEDERRQLIFATCKCSNRKNLARISEMFHNEEVQCQVLREDGDVCINYLEEPE